MPILKKLLGSDLKVSDIIMNTVAKVGFDFNGLPDKLYIKSVRTKPSECTVPKIPVKDTITTNGEQAILFLPDSVRRRPKILDPILKRFPNYILFGTRRDIISINPTESYNLLEEICDSSLRYVQNKEINPDDLTVLGICSGNCPATRLANKLGARNLYSVLSAGEVSEGVFSSEATRKEVKELIKRGISKEDYHELIKEFDPITYITRDIKNIVGVFGGTDRMVRKSAWTPLAEKIIKVGGKVREYRHLGHCTSMYRFTKELERKEI